MSTTAFIKHYIFLLVLWCFILQARDGLTYTYSTQKAIIKTANGPYYTTGPYLDTL